MSCRLACVVALAPACMFAVAGCRVFGVGLACDGDDQCAGNQRCVDGSCSSEPGDGEGDLGEGEGEGDAGEGEGEGEGDVGEGEGEGEGEGDACTVLPIDPAVCGGVGALRESFDGGLGDWVVVGDVQTSGGVLEMNGPSGAFARTPVVIGDGMEVALGVDDADVPTATNDVARLTLQPRYDTSDDALSLFVDEGAYHALVAAAGQTTDNITNGQFTEGDRLWIIRRDGAALSFLVDNDPPSGAPFTIATLPAPPFIDEPLYLAIELRTTSGARFRVRELNQRATPQRSCDTTDLGEAFCDQSAAPRFRELDDAPLGDASSCTLQEAPDGLHITINGTDDARCGYTSTGAYDLLGQTAVFDVDLSSLSDGGVMRPGFALSFALLDAQRHPFGLTLVEGDMHCGLLPDRLDQQLGAGVQTAPIGDPAAVTSVRLSFSDTGVTCGAGDVEISQAGPGGLGTPGLMHIGLFAFDPPSSPAVVVVHSVD